MPVVILEYGARHFRLMRWGFVPSWVKDPGKITLLINARSETINEKPAFKNAMRRRRCLIPADGYYEWQVSGGRKRPFFIHRRDGAMFGLAALAENWIGPNGEEVETVAIVTAAASTDLAVLHHRVPVTLMPGDFDRWLDCDSVPAEDAATLIKPVDEALLEVYPISPAVNRVANDSEALIAPPSAQTEQAAPAPRAKPSKTKSDDQPTLF